MQSIKLNLDQEFQKQIKSNPVFVYFFNDYLFIISIRYILEYSIKLNQDYAQFHFNQCIPIPQINKVTHIQHIASYLTQSQISLLLLTNHNQPLLIQINPSQFQIIDLNSQVSSISKLFYKPQPFTQHQQSVSIYADQQLLLIAQFTSNIQLTYYQDSQVTLKSQIPIKSSYQFQILPGSILITNPNEINFLYCELYQDGYIVKLQKTYLDINYTIANIVQIELHRDEIYNNASFRSTLLSFNNQLHALFQIQDQSYYVYGDDQFITNSINSQVLGFGILSNQHSQHLQLALPDKIVQLNSQLKPLNDKIVKGMEKDIYQRINSIYLNSDQPVIEFRLKVEGVYNTQSIGATINLMSTEILDEQSRTILLSFSVQSQKDVIKQELDRKLEKLERWKEFIQECSSEAIQKYCLNYLYECINKTLLGINIRQYQFGFEIDIRQVLREWSYLDNEQVEHFYTRLNNIGEIIKVTKSEDLMLMYLDNPFELNKWLQCIIDYCKCSQGNKLIELLTQLIIVIAKYEQEYQLIEEIVDIYLKFNLMQDLISILDKHGFYREILGLYFKDIKIIDKVNQVLCNNAELGQWFIERCIRLEKERLNGKLTNFRFNQIVDDFHNKKCMEILIDSLSKFPHLQFHILGSLKMFQQTKPLINKLSIRMSDQQAFSVSQF